MLMKIQRDTNVMLALSEDEARALMALVNFPGRGVLPIADDIYDTLRDAGIDVCSNAYESLHDDFRDTFGDER